MRTLPIAGLLLVTLSACGQLPGAGGERACTMIGSSPGISVEVVPAFAMKAMGGTVEACWGGRCVSGDLRLDPSTRAGNSTCSGENPEDVCSAQMVPTGGKNGFVALPDLPTAPIRVNVTITGSGGGTLSSGALDLSPAMTYPNGPDCGGGSAQAALLIDATGAPTPR